uniref:Uncharacterized protein n=1 Tax=Heterorhabditis bacteriophora TaxID=37862 RepID=A0A1I7X2R8_HETBA
MYLIIRNAHHGWSRCLGMWRALEWRRALIMELVRERVM